METITFHSNGFGGFRDIIAVSSISYASMNKNNCLVMRIDGMSLEWPIGEEGMTNEERLPIIIDVLQAIGAAMNLSDGNGHGNFDIALDKVFDKTR